MGVPKFFRWLSERYPKINQRAGYLPDEETCYKHFDRPPPAPLEQPDPLSTCGLPPPIDRLYIDMNGIIHGCSHNNSNPEDKEEGSASQITNAEIFRNVGFYLDRIVGDIAKPTELIYMAIDGVAPRAKLNQQRSRRYRSSREGMIERTVYEAHMHSLEQARLQAVRADADPATTGVMGSFFASLKRQGSDEAVQEVEPGRYAGKFETEDDSSIETRDDLFHSNSITPGTPFFEECTRHIEHFIRYKLTHDPKWQHLTVIFSGPNVPGEGEHKIMEFIRKERYRKDYNPNLRHCIMGQDGDLIMLGLVTHEPNLVLLREQVIFEMDRRMALERHSKGVDMYIYNANFEWLHMNVLRDYLAFEFETRGVVPDNEFELEPTIDDFVFLTFFVGNDFLPHMPALDIADEAFELLFATYKRLRWKWLKDKKRPPYLTNSGDIVSGKRLEQFLSAVGSYEDPYHHNKESESKNRIESWRKSDKRMGFKSAIPDDTVMESKEMSDRAKYREMLQSIDPVKATGASDSRRFSPVLSGSDLPTFKPSPAEQDLEDNMLSRIGNLLQYSVSSNDKSEETLSFGALDDSDTKGRYYFDKFGFTPFDAEKHIALRKAYIEGLVWTLKYYYQGVVSWDWYYPYHYGPMLSDLVDVDEMLAEISFDKDKKGEPLRPFEQLMGCMPPSSANALPKPYQWLLTDPSSPIIDFYPRSFTVDMNGKRWPWEAVVLLPFIDSKRLVEAARTLVTDDMLSDEEKSRNQTGHALLFARNESYTDKITAVGDGEGFVAMNDCKVPKVALSATSWSYEPDTTAVFRPELVDGVAHPLPGFPSLRTVPIERLVRRRIGVNVFGLRSRYRTAILELADTLPELPPAEVVADKLIGTTVQFNFPFFLEGFVTAVSSSEMSVRGVGSNRVQYYDRNEIETRKQRVSSLVKSHLFGENLTGSGGWKIPSGDVTVSVRPFQGFKMTRDGLLVKTFAKFEVELPLIAAVWGPSQNDPRLANFPVLLEKDPYFVKRTSDGFILTGISVEHESRMDLLPNLPEVPLPSNVAVDASSLLPAAVKVPDYPGQPINARKEGNLLGSRGSSRSMSTAAFNQTGTEWMKDVRRRETFRAAELVFRRRETLRPRGYGRGALLIVGVASFVSIFLGCGEVSAVQWPCRLRRHVPVVLEASCLLLRGGAHTENCESTKSITPPPLEFAHGTTTISFVFKDGIVAAVDSRASLGNFVGSKTTQKVLPVNSHILGTMAGGAADCSFWIRKLQAEVMLHELTEGKRMTVARASRLLSNALYNNRGLNLSVGTMIMGIDPDDEKPRIYYVDNSGVRIAGDVFAVGSGSTFALGILDTERQPDMAEDEAIALGIKAIRHATFRDAYSGGFIGVYLINKHGWRKVFSQDMARSADP